MKRFVVLVFLVFTCLGAALPVQAQDTIGKPVLRKGFYMEMGYQNTGFAAGNASFFRFQMGVAPEQGFHLTGSFSMLLSNFESSYTKTENYGDPIYSVGEVFRSKLGGLFYFALHAEYTFLRFWISPYLSVQLLAGVLDILNNSYGPEIFPFTGLEPEAGIQIETIRQLNIRLGAGVLVTPSGYEFIERPTSLNLYAGLRWFPAR